MKHDTVDKIVSHVDFYDPVNVFINKNEKFEVNNYYVGFVCKSSYEKKEYIPYLVTLKYFNYLSLKQKRVSKLNLLFKKYSNINELEVLFQSNQVGSFIVFDEYSILSETAKSILHNLLILFD